MTMTADAAAQMISDFGETVTVKPQASQEPKDSSNPVYFEETSSSVDPYDVKVRVYTTPSKEMLQEYGFSDESEALIYNDSNEIEEGDIVDIFGDEYVVSEMQTNQMGNGAYIWVYSLIGN